MAPFRNELEASHARIAQLEAEKAALERRNALLESQLRQSRIAIPRPPLAWVGLIPMATAVLIAAMAVLISVRQRACPHYNRLSPAITVPSHRELSQPIPSYRESPSLTPYHRYQNERTAPCNCITGDPSCTCLHLPADQMPGY
ncbi:tropomyosin [Pendulispora brunnea]|uniref:Tropomyosin n=1 Tax=Pendulispora brunnea TaxID=2905690 RepID=A0ABZ2KDB0_9BACT